MRTKRKKMVAAMVTAKEAREVKRAAARDGRSVSSFLRRCLVEANVLSTEDDSGGRSTSKGAAP